VDALMRIVAWRPPANVAVSWCGIDEMIEGLQLPAEPPAAIPLVQTGANDQTLAGLEQALLTHPSLESCAVMMRKDRTGAERTVCYVVFKRSEHATVSDLRRFVKSKVGGGRRVPSTFVTLEALPRQSGGSGASDTSDGRDGRGGGVGSGAVDYDSLPDPFGVADTFVAPRTETESTIAESWIEALGVPRVSIHDNFFDIGGHSLLAVRVVTRLDRQLGVRLSQAIMVLQTLEQIAAECDRQRVKGSK
jgi:hypothetical protein